MACEFSGTIREEFKKLGWDAWSCDLLPTEIPGNHYQCDVLTVLDKGWDLMIAHPECTYMCNSGVCWLYKKDKNGQKVKDKTRWANMRKGAKFLKTLLECDIPRICVENPIPHKYALEIIGRKYDQIVHPWQHNHPETKATCLWLKNLPKLEPTNVVDPVNGSALHRLPPSKDRWKKRSLTYSGIAKALATQYDLHVRKELSA